MDPDRAENHESKTKPRVYVDSTTIIVSMLSTSTESVETTVMFHDSDYCGHDRTVLLFF
jgi:hypothetical protein